MKYTATNWNNPQNNFVESFYSQNTSQFWMPEEIALSPDLNVWQNLPENVKRAYIQNLVQLTFFDSHQGNKGMLYLQASLDDKTQDQIKVVVSFMNMMENIHAKSYSTIFTSYLDPSSIEEYFKWGENNEHLQKLMNLIIDNYKELGKAVAMRDFNLGEVSDLDYKIKQWKAMASSVLLETYLFYSGFYYPLWFYGQGKLMQAGEIINLIIRDECLTGDAQLLTPNGWKNIDEIKEGDRVLEYDSLNKVTQFNNVVKTSKKYEPKTYKLQSKSGFYQKTSGGHSLVYLKDNKVNKTVMADFIPTKDKFFIRNADYKNPLNTKNILSNIERLKIAIQADGSIDNTKRDDGSYKRDGSRTGFIPVRFTLTKERKKERLVNLINELGYKYTTKPLKDKSFYTVYVPKDVLGDLSKIKAPFYDYSLTELSSNWCKEFIEELVCWDGHIRKDINDNYYFGTTNKEMFNFVENVALLAGYSIKTGFEDDNRKNTYKRIYRLYINKKEEARFVRSSRCEKIECQGEYVYGVQVPSTNLVIKQNNYISITGNCIHGLFIGLLAKEIYKDFNSELQVELKDWLLSLIKEIYEVQCLLAEEIYDPVNLTHDVKIFMRYNCNKALMNLGFDAYFEEEEVNPVVLNGLNTESKTHDYFSMKGNSYQKSTVEEIKDGDFDF